MSAKRWTLAAAVLLAAASAPAPAAVAATPDVAKRALPSVVTIIAQNSQGTGFAYGASGRLLTNAHVVGRSERVDVITAGGKRVDGAVLARDARADLAIVAVAINVPAL